MVEVMKPHRFAELFPPILGDEWEAFKGSIREKGVTDPVVRFEGKCLDGLNRQRAVEELVSEGVTAAANGKAMDLPVADFSGTAEEAMDWVMQHNFTRRHLTASQRAAIGVRAARLAGMLDAPKRGKARKKPAKNGAKQSADEAEASADSVSTDNPDGLANFIAARSGTSKRLVQECLVIEKEQPKLLDQIIADETPTHKAYAEVKGRGKSAQNGEAAGAAPAPAKIKGGDGNDVDLDSIYVGVFQSRDDFAEMLAMLKRGAEQFDGLVGGAGGKWLGGEEVQAAAAAFRTLRGVVSGARPHVVCPVCEGARTALGGRKKCESCRGRGYLSAGAYRGYKKQPPEESAGK